MKLKERGITAKGKKVAIVALATQHNIPVSETKEKYLKGGKGSRKECIKFCGNEPLLIQPRVRTTRH